MATKMVVDASVAAKWFLQDPAESDVDLANELLLSMLAGETEIHAPDVLSYEVCSVLVSACLTRQQGQRIPRLPKDKAIRCIRGLFALPIHMHAVAEQKSVEALEWAVDYAKGYYDMLYLRLADELDCAWYTADKKILRANRPGFPSHRVFLLSSLRRT